MQNFWDLSTGPVRGKTPQEASAEREVRASNGAGVKILLIMLSVVVIAEGIYINIAMRGNLASVFARGNTCERVLSKWEAAHPDEAKKRSVYTGVSAEVNYKNTPLTQAANFKTAIDDAVAKGANFAGNFVVAQWGCGTQCQGHAIVNVQTGKIITFGPSSEAGLGITPDSNLLIVNPKENFPSPADMQKASLDTLLSLANLPREYYVLEGEGDAARLQKICTENPFEGQGI